MIDILRKLILENVYELIMAIGDAMIIAKQGEYIPGLIFFVDLTVDLQRAMRPRVCACKKRSSPRCCEIPG